MTPMPNPNQPVNPVEEAQETRVINIRNAPRGWENNPQYVYIGRAGKGQDGYFGNPFKLSKHEERGATLARFEAHARRLLDTDIEYRRRVRDLYGKTLVCFCHPQPCHGDVLAKLAAVLSTQQPVSEVKA